ncbi:MAG: FHA domain-containing protein [Kiritimatiellae bacterium]|nr:FHA domain-containing protein [Kiritimatiellia bacterium]
MNTPKLELVVSAGPLKGRRYTVSETGTRLGRSSSCEIAVPDPALSRSHCLFEMRNGEIWVTDLASANGTIVNGTELGSDSVKLAPGDIVLAGDTEIKVAMDKAQAAVDAGVEQGGDVGAQPTVETEAEPAGGPIDLGLGGGDAVEPADAGDGPVKPNVMRLALWAVAGLAVLAAAFMILGTPPAADEPEVRPVAAVEPVSSGRLLAVSYEKIRASSEGIYRFALSYSQDGMLSAMIDDVPKTDRHVDKTLKLSPAKVERLDSQLKDAALYSLQSAYVGASLRPDELKSVRLRIVRTTGAFETSVENMQEPEALRDARERLEAFAKNELGIWGIDKSVDELKAMSADARRNGDAKWEERDVQHGNLAQAIAAYDEAAMLLETVNPKPDGFDSLLQRIREAKAELDRRYREQCFRADKAINLKDWSTALIELRTLCDLVPDDRDPRHAEANAKLLDVESRQKGGRK